MGNFSTLKIITNKLDKVQLIRIGSSKTSVK